MAEPISMNFVIMRSAEFRALSGFHASSIIYAFMASFCLISCATALFTYMPA